MAPSDASETGRKSASRDRGGIQSLERAVDILDAVAANPAGVGLAEISARAGLHTSTAFHLIKTLTNLGMLIQEPETKRYRIGRRLFTLAAGALEDTTLLTLATPVLERLSAETGYAAHLAVLSGREVVVIARTAATGLLQLAGRAGATRPAHATAIGKTLLAALPEPELDRLLAELDLPRLTENTITDPVALRAQLEAARRDGVAHDDCELDPDVRCLAIPVHDFTGRCAGAIGVSGPAWRLTPKALRAAEKAVRAAAATLSDQLGGGAKR